MHIVYLTVSLIVVVNLIRGGNFEVINPMNSLSGKEFKVVIGKVKM